MRSGHLISVCLLACLPLGCANWPYGKTLPGGAAAGNVQLESASMQLIATDFVQALQQIPTFAPSATTVQLLRSALQDPFTVSMRDALQAAGYATRWVGDDAHELLFQYRHERSIDKAERPQDLYEIAVGGAEMRRRYATGKDYRISPVTPLYVRGADASGIRMNDSLFEQQERATPVQQIASTSMDGEQGTPQQVLGSSRLPPAETAPVASQGQLSVPDDINPLNPLISGGDRQQDLSLPLIALPRVENVFELGGSNFEEMLSEHKLVREQVLTFANDSLRLGEVNKILVEQMVEFFEPETDVFSVLGCSLGPTQMSGGNAALALGRASRVREALLFAGVPQDRILDEGCWAGDGSGEALPRRGVVVTLNRKV